MGVSTVGAVDDLAAKGIDLKKGAGVAADLRYDLQGSGREVGKSLVISRRKIPKWKWIWSPEVSHNRASQVLFEWAFGGKTEGFELGDQPLKRRAFCGAGGGDEDGDFAMVHDKPGEERVGKRRRDLKPSFHQLEHCGITRRSGLKSLGSQLRRGSLCAESKRRDHSEIAVATTTTSP